MNDRLRSYLTLIVAVIALTSAHAAHKKKPLPPPPIAIVINGETLPLDPPPLLEKGVLLVPARRTIVALGLDFTLSGSRMITHVGSKTVVLEEGSRIATVDGVPVALDAPAVRRNGALYVPLRFFTALLGAEAKFDRRANVVAIVSQLVGRMGIGDFTVGGMIVRVGTVTAVDVDSDPPTVTLQFNGAVRTIPISNNAIVTMHDVGVDVEIPGELTDVRPGDYAEISMRKNGTVSEVVDEYGSRYGVIAVANPDELLMQDGHVIVPDRDTQITLNGDPASFSDLQAGDHATIRYNVETDEVREIIAVREEAQTSAQSGSASISDVEIDAVRPLRAGEVLTVTMHGTSGGAATFDVGAYVRGVAMAEHSPGTYEGRYHVNRSASFADTPIIVHLRMPDGSTVAARAAQAFSASAQPPGIVTVGPADGTSIDSDMPAIYATFVTEAVPVNPTSVQLKVNGHDVTSECLRTTQFVQYFPQRRYRRGLVRVDVRVSDEAGNTATRSWTFTIR